MRAAFLLLMGVTLAWDRNVETNVVSYSIYWGTNSGQYIRSTNVGNVTTATLANASLPLTNIYFAVTAIDSNGLESEPSNEVWWDNFKQPPKPKVPGEVTIENLSEMHWINWPVP